MLDEAAKAPGKIWGELRLSASHLCSTGRPNRNSVLSESHEVQKGRGAICDLVTVSSGEEKQQQQIIIRRV